MKAKDAIKKHITKYGIKQTFIAEKTGIPINTISKTLNGKRKLPADEYLAICEAINADPKEIVKPNLITNTA